MLQVNLVIEDAKISLEELQEEIQEFEDYVQSTDVAGKSSLCAGSGITLVFPKYVGIEADNLKPCKSSKRGGLPSGLEDRKTYADCF